MPTAMKSQRLSIFAVLLLLALLFSATSVHSWGSSEDAKAIAKRGKAEQIHFWEKEVQTLQRGEMSRAMNKLYQKQAALEAARKKEGIFYTRPEDKATIRLLDEDYRRTLVEVSQVKEQENMMLAKLKPLYGVVSLQFAQEQKQTIADSIKAIQTASYDNAWYSSLFNIGDAESISDVIVGFLGQWLVGFLIMYPFAVLYYAFWAAPWSVYAYSAGITDLVPGVVAYVVSVFVMCLPLLALIGAFYGIYVVYKPKLQEAARRARAQQHYHQD